MLKALGHSGFERFLLELGLPDPSVGSGSGLQARTNSLARYALDNPNAVTAEGQPLSAALVAEAGRIYREGISTNIGDTEREAFQQSSSNDGALSDVTLRSTPLATSPPLTPLSTFGGPAHVKPNPRVFIVHGHDAVMKLDVANFIRAIGLEPVILADQPNGGKTVIEKFEKNADVGYAIILLSPDDYSPAGSTGRSRQNVILEWGYFIGRLGRAHVCALKRGDVELPSDIIGIAWEAYDDHGGWKRNLVKELIEAGVQIDPHKASTA